MGTLLDRVASGENLSGDDITEYVREAIRDSQIEGALTRDDLRSDLAQLIRKTHLNVMYDVIEDGNREIAEKLVEQSAQIEAMHAVLKHELPKLRQQVTNITVEGDVSGVITNVGGTITFEGDVTLVTSATPAGPATHRHLTVFLSSPGDVTTERDIVRDVVEGLNHDPLLKDMKVSLELVAWDTPGAGIPMLATDAPQESVNTHMDLPADCDIVVVVLWSRMGTPLPEHITKPDGSRYLSGTEWEYLNALEGYEVTGSRPKTLVYRRDEAPAITLDDPELQDKIEQYQRVKDFFAGFYAEDGSIERGFNPYDDTEQFRRDVERHLKAIISQIVREARYTPPSIVRDASDSNSQPDWHGSPFPGLRAFTPADEPIFYGRGAETDALVEQVCAHRFVAVVGASGSGKSSLVGAGLLPRLRERVDWHLPGYENGHWTGLRFTPGQQGENPFMALAARLHRDEPRPVAERLTNTPAQLSDVIREYLPGQSALLFIDQFEEVFTLVADRYRRPFMDMLVSAAHTENLRVVVTVRADFLHRFIEFGKLNALLNSASFNLAAPRLGALYAMITRPAQRAGLTFEPGLPEQILDDTGSDPGGLALMAYALDELYKVADGRKDGRLTFADYNALGGVQGAIGTRAETTFVALPGEDDPKASLLGSVFRDLVEVDERGTPTRRRKVYQPETAPDAERQMIRAFTDARLLVTSEDAGEATVEVAHEALLREWGRLADWIAEVQDDLAAIRRMERDAIAWKERDEPEHMLPNAEEIEEFNAACERLGRAITDPVLLAFTEPEQERLYRELETLPRTAESHERRRDIGDRLAVIGDTRSGIGVVDGVPDMDWLPVAVSPEPVTIKTDENEIGPLTIHPFCIARYLVTYPQFQAFIEADDGFDYDRWWVDMPNKYKKQEMNDQRTKTANAPRDSVSWYQCVAFARWLNHRLQGLEVSHPDGVLRVGDNAEIRLPTEWEWQWAAQGGAEAREYPWEGGWLEGYANTSEAGLSRTTAVGMYPHGAAVSGALDMAGNLREWCLNQYRSPDEVGVDNSGAVRVVRGGAFSSQGSDSRCAYRGYDVPSNRDLNLGLRVCCGAPLFS